MIEYSGNEKENNVSDIVNRCPIYIGEYSKENDDEEGLIFKRHGKGKLIDERSGFCLRESTWCNGVEEDDKGCDFFNGWYSKWDSEESIRCNVIEKEIMNIRRQEEEEMEKRKRKEMEERKRKEYEESLDREIDIYYESTTQLSNKLKRGLNEWTIRSNEYQNGLTGDMSKFRLELSDFPLLERIVLEGNNFQQIRNFVLNDLPKLMSITIGEDCFRVKSGDYYPYGENPGLFRLTNCPELESLTIGKNSFCDYTKFEISELPKLTNLSIGEYCFTSSDCILKGINYQ